jgi:hypothetical protein
VDEVERFLYHGINHPCVLFKGCGY